jgi:hypothetical protein
MSFVGLSRPFPGPLRRAAMPSRDDGARGDTPLRERRIAAPAAGSVSAPAVALRPTSREKRPSAAARDVSGATQPVASVAPADGDPLLDPR